MKTALRIAVVATFVSHSAGADTQTSVVKYLQQLDISVFSTLKPSTCAAESDHLTESLCRTALAMYALDNAEYVAGSEQLEEAIENIQAVHLANLPVLWETHFNPDALATRQKTVQDLIDPNDKVQLEECFKKQMALTQVPERQASPGSADDAIKAQQQAMMQKLLEMNQKLDGKAYMQMSDADKSAMDENMRRQTNQITAEFRSALLERGQQSFQHPNAVSADCIGQSGMFKKMTTSVTKTPFGEFQDQYLSLNASQRQDFKRRWMAGEQVSLSTLNLDGMASAQNTNNLGNANVAPFLFKLNAAGMLPYQPVYMYLQQAKKSLQSGNADDALPNLQNAIQVGASLLAGTPQQQRSEFNHTSFHDIRQQLTLMNANIRREMSRQIAANPMGAAVMMQSGMFRTNDTLQNELNALRSSAGANYLPTEALNNFLLIAAGNQSEALASLQTMVQHFKGHPEINAIEAETLWYAVAYNVFVENAPSQVESIPVKTLLARSVNTQNEQRISKAYELARQTDNTVLQELTGTMLTLFKVVTDQSQNLPDELEQKAEEFQKAISKGQRQQMIYFTSKIAPALEYQPLNYLSPE